MSVNLILSLCFNQHPLVVALRGCPHNAHWTPDPKQMAKEADQVLQDFSSPLQLRPIKTEVGRATRPNPWNRVKNGECSCCRRGKGTQWCIWEVYHKIMGLLMQHIQILQNVMGYTGPLGLQWVGQKIPFQGCSNKQRPWKWLCNRKKESGLGNY